MLWIGSTGRVNLLGKLCYVNTLEHHVNVKKLDIFIYNKESANTKRGSIIQQDSIILQPNSLGFNSGSVMYLQSPLEQIA